MTHPDTCAAIVLAAGFSRRMQAFKPLLPLQGISALERVVRLYQAAGVAALRVVTGFNAAAVTAALAAQPVTIVHNPDPARGMFSSVCSGLANLPSDIGAVFVHPVDIPLVRPHTVIRLRRAFAEDPAPVIYPTFEGRRGHPPLIRGTVLPAIAAHGGTGGLRLLLGRFDDQAREIPVADEGVLLDMDRPADFRRLDHRLATGHILTDSECRELLHRVEGLPAPVIAHCRQVAAVAQALAEAICDRGGALDIALVRAAALVHDVARSRPDHAAAGAHLLDTMGFPAMAAVVAGHMDLGAAAAVPLDEARIVYLADKLVAGDRVVDLARRFASKRQAHGHPDALAGMARRQHLAREIQAAVERRCGQPVERILDSAGIVREGLPCATC